MPYRQGRADGAAGIAGGRLQIDLPKRRAVLDLAVGDGIVGAAAGKRDGAMAVAALQRRQEMEKGVLVNGLCRESQIAMPHFERRIWGARRPELFDQRMREQSTADGFA